VSGATGGVGKDVGKGIAGVGNGMFGETHKYVVFDDLTVAFRS
jgi:hypothetical protein